MTQDKASIQEARRVAFEAFYESHTQGWPVAISNCCREQVELIYNAALDSMVVELPGGLTLEELRDGAAKPDPSHERWLTRPGCIQAIEAAGIRCEVRS